MKNFFNLSCLLRHFHCYNASMTSGITDSPSLNVDKLRPILEAASGSDDQLFRSIVNAPFRLKVESAFLFLGIIVLLQVDKKTGMIDRVSLSNTELAKNTTEVSFVPFEEIKIPLSHPENIISRTIITDKPHDTTDWNYLFTPALSAEQARLNQASGGIAYSAVYPLKARDGGAIIYSYFQYMHNIGDSQHEFMRAYSQLVDELLGGSAAPSKSS